ncbi:GGDEF domain-containing phosphodiesterase [Novosphingobium sp.]|uniref:GGDEF domain-containing phosphodiesterase n=1 Tax=Novosphingobium sp. TaxID=1874826 RepID=UPI0025CE8FE0|nr:GGDEF domain-containing phosphodiesterase [Novosphingobium sp.]
MTGTCADELESARDAVTGLTGRDGAKARLAQWLKDGLQVHAMLLGLRRFDAVNLAYGSAAGDGALAEVALRLKHFAASELDGGWLIARSGGGQFLLLSAQPCSRESWQVAAAQLLDALARPIACLGVTLRLSPRAALLRGLDSEDADSMLDRLGQALSRVMTQPGRRLLWADGEGARAGRSAAQLEVDLLGALDGGEIEVVYQPQFACADDRLVGGEALARWNHPQLGRIGAGALFSIAERADHVAQLSRHIARLAMSGAQRWPMDLRLSLNVTPNDLAEEAFAAEFMALAAACRFPLWRLTLEVTEQVLLADVIQAARSLESLAAGGARIALDDFGAGFCNFRYLKLLPLHKLKLDRSMVDGIAANPRDLAVLRGIVAMARALDLSVIAEGIESEAQRVLVAAEGCSAYQGFLRAQPLSADAFNDFATGR